MVPPTVKKRNRGASLTTEKRASRVADQIVRDVMERGWPVGTVLGSEPEMLERYDVSRAVFREAVRLVEHLQVARTRRGPGGGLVVTEPTVGAVVSAVVLYLHQVDARLTEVFEARIVLEGLACELAPQRLSESDLYSLRAVADQGSQFMAEKARSLHSLVATSTGNAAIELFVDVLNRISHLYSTSWKQGVESDVGEQSALAHARIAEAVISGDGGLARHRMAKHLAAEEEYLRARRSTRQLLPARVILSGAADDRQAEIVARQLLELVITRGLRPGDLVGTEPELIEREGLTRSGLREAVRLLEHHGIARMRTGAGGGLYVSEPDASGVTDVAAIFLARRDMQLDDLLELRSGIEVALAGMAAERAGTDGVARLHAALEVERTGASPDPRRTVHDVHALVARAASNRVLELVALVLIRLGRLRRIETRGGDDLDRIGVDVRRAHEGIVAAIETGDREMARHRMQRHLDALTAVVKA